MPSYDPIRLRGGPLLFRVLRSLFSGPSLEKAVARLPGSVLFFFSEARWATLSRTRLARLRERVAHLMGRALVKTQHLETPCRRPGAAGRGRRESRGLSEGPPLPIETHDGEPSEGDLLTSLDEK